MKGHKIKSARTHQHSRVLTLYESSDLEADSDGGVAHRQQRGILGPVDPAHSEVSVADPLHHGDVEVPAEETHRGRIRLRLVGTSGYNLVYRHLSLSCSGGCSSWVWVAPNRFTTDNFTAGLVCPAWMDPHRKTLTYLNFTKSLKHVKVLLPYHRVWVLQASGVGAAGELGQSHVRYQGVVDGEEGQSLPIRRPPVSQVWVKNLLWREKGSGVNDTSQEIIFIFHIFRQLSCSFSGSLYVVSSIMKWSMPSKRQKKAVTRQMVTIWGPESTNRDDSASPCVCANCSSSVPNVFTQRLNGL